MNLSSTELQQSQRSVLQKRCSTTKFNILKNTYSSFFSTVKNWRIFLYIWIWSFFYVLMTRKILQMIFSTMVCFILDKSEIIANVLVWNSMKHAKHDHEFVSFGIYWSNTSKYKTVQECYFTQLCISAQHSQSYSVFCSAKKRFRNSYVETRGDYQTCKMKNAGCWMLGLKNSK